MRRLKPYFASPTIRQKLEKKHHVLIDELNELFDGDPLFFRKETDIYGERRYLAMGKTDAGRLLTVIFTVQSGGRAKVITAREMSGAEQRFYRSRKR